MRPDTYKLSGRVTGCGHMTKSTFTWSSSWTSRFVKLTLWYEIPINFKLSVSYRSPLQYAECNINIHMWARHEHQGLWNLLFGIKYLSVLSFQFHTDHHSKMMNATSRLAVRIQHLPDWEVDWEDTKPQKSRRELKLLNFAKWSRWWRIPLESSPLCDAIPCHTVW